VLPASRLGRGRLSGRYSTTSVPKSDAVTAPAVAPQPRCDGATVAPHRAVTASPPAVEHDHGIGDEERDCLRLPLRVGTFGAFIAAFRKRAQIILADVDRQPPNPASRAFPQGPHSFGRCCHVLPLCREDGARKFVLNG
jgi:hypothetical protein